MTVDDDPRAASRQLFVELAGLDEGDPRRVDLRNTLVELHLPLVRHLVGRFVHRGEPVDDLVQVATIGLIHAVDRFDVERGLEFSTFATPTIVGELKRHFRDRASSIRLPRRTQELRLALVRASEDLAQQLRRSPTVAELAAHLGIGDEEVLEGLESANATTVSLDGGGSENGLALLDTLGADDEALGAVEDRVAMEPLLASLPARERRILSLRFASGLTQSEIAEQVGISQMHVSRLLTATLAYLREALHHDDTEPAGP